MPWQRQENEIAHVSVHVALLDPLRGHGQKRACFASTVDPKARSTRKGGGADTDRGDAPVDPQIKKIINII